MIAIREQLAASQAELVRALVAGGPIPAGFDEARVRLAARTLVNKRRQALARVWQSLVKTIGDSYVESFNRYAQSQPLPGCASPRGDGRAYLRWLDSQGASSDAASLEALSFDLRFVATKFGLQRRRGVCLKWARLPQSRKLVLALRLPWFGERWWGMPRA